MVGKSTRFRLKIASVFLLVLATSTSVTGNCEITECGRYSRNDNVCMDGYEEISREPCKTETGTRGKMVYCCPKNSTESLLSTMYGAELNEFPHMAMLYAGGYQCGATIYNSRYVLTAAHCLVGPDDGVVFSEQNAEVKVGRNIITVENSRNDYKVEKIIVHPKYSHLHDNWVDGKAPANFLNDIALLKLDRKIEFGPRVKSLELAPKGFNELDYADKAVIVGWGTTHTFELSDHLQKAHVVIRTDETCFEDYHSPHPQDDLDDSKQLLCVGGHWDGINDPTAGEGDSGGPAICRGPGGYGVLCGVTSYGGGDEDQPDKSCYDNGDEAHCQPSVYAEVDYYRGWILKNAGKQEPNTFFKAKLFGEVAPESRQVHQVHITSAEGKPCGGTLIRPDTVVTAAQCVAPGDGSGKKYTKLTVTTATTGTKHPVLFAEIHPDFKRFVSKLPGGRYGRTKRMISSYQPHALEQMTLITDHYHENDLAVLKLTTPVKVNQKLLPRLPELNEEPSSPAYELSFPRNVTYGADLMQREFNILEKDECQRRMNRMDRIGYKTDVDENILCGVEKYSGGSTCDRELGGGLICTREDGSETLCGIQIYRLCQWSIPNGFLDVKLHRKFIRGVADVKIKTTFKKV